MLLNRPTIRSLSIATFALVFAAGIGYALIAASHADTALANAEAEQGILTGVATPTNDEAASNGAAVRFGSIADLPGATAGCSVNNVMSPCIGSASTSQAGWGAPIFSDEFNDGIVDKTTWTPHWVGGDCDAGSTINNAISCSKNITEQDGYMRLIMSAPHEGAFIFSTKPQLAIGGFAEARVYLSGDASKIHNWPAWWTCGTFSAWPASGENDIVEAVTYPSVSYHGGTQAMPEHKERLFVDAATPWANSYHTYGLHRKSASEHIIYWDGKPVATYSTNDTKQAQHLIFDIGSLNDGFVTGLASQMKVDYVRVWQK